MNMNLFKHFLGTFLYWRRWYVTDLIDLIIYKSSVLDCQLKKITYEWFLWLIFHFYQHFIVLIAVYALICRSIHDVDP